MKSVGVKAYNPPIPWLSYDCLFSNNRGDQGETTPNNQSIIWSINDIQ